MKNNINLIKKLGLLYISKVLIYKLLSIKYKFIFNSFWKWSYIYWYLDLFKKWTINIWNKCIIESSYRKSHFWCDFEWMINIWDNVFINQWLIIDSGPNKIHIWNNVKIWPNVTIISVDNHWLDYWIVKTEKNIFIWENTWIWANCIILPWVTIWNNSIIWAWSVVTHNQLKNSLNAWNPCKFIKYLN